MTENINPFTIQPTIDVGYKIIPFQYQEPERIQEGTIWRLNPRQSTKVQRIVEPKYQICVEAVNGIGFYLSQSTASADSTLNIQVASPLLDDYNPTPKFSQGEIICFIACSESSGEFVVEGKGNMRFNPNFEKEVFSGRDRVQILKLGKQKISLVNFWQAKHILKTQSLNFIANYYPQLQPPIDRLISS